MSTRQTNAYQRVMQKRAKRLGISVDEAERQPVSSSRYLAATQATAARLGVDLNQILEEDQVRLETSNYPTAECITPEDVEDLIEALGQQNLGMEQINSAQGQQVVASVWSKQMKHLASCDPCRTLLSACQPNPLLRDQFVAYVMKKYPLVAATVS